MSHNPHVGPQISKGTNAWAAPPGHLPDPSLAPDSGFGKESSHFLPKFSENIQKRERVIL